MELIEPNITAITPSINNIFPDTMVIVMKNIIISFMTTFDYKMLASRKYIIKLKGIKMFYQREFSK